MEVSTENAPSTTQEESDKDTPNVVVDDGASNINQTDTTETVTNGAAKVESVNGTTSKLTNGSEQKV